jgi:hypothetical protein
MEIMSAYKRLQYSPFDILIILMGLGCIALGTHYFNNQPFESGEFRETETFGFISAGNGTRKVGNSLQWFDVDKKTELYYGDVIFANENKDIQIELLDKESSLTVPEDSMIRITKSGDEFNLDVSKGSVLIKTKSNKKINLRDKRGKIRKLVISKNSNVKISSKQSNVTVEALKGKASITKVNSNVKLEVKKGKILLVGPKISKVMNKAQIIQTKIVDPVFTDRVLLTKKYMNFKTMEISEKDDFKIKSNIPIVKGEIDIRQLAYGRYFLRESDKLGYDEFELKRLKPIELTIGEREKYYQGDDINISWNGRGELMYRVDIESEKPFSKLVQGNKFAYSVQDSGIYKIKITEQKFERTSNTQEIDLTVNKDLNILGFEDVKSSAETTRSIKLKNPRKVKYKIKVTNQDGKIFVNKKTTVESYDIKNLKPGLYGTEIINLKTNKPYYKSEFTVTDKIEKYKTEKLIRSDKKKLVATLKWKRSGTYPKNVEYTVKIYDSKDATEPILEETTTKNSFSYSRDKAGSFFWSVDSNAKEMLAPSDRYEIQMLRPEFGKITTPQIVLQYMEEKDCYEFSIPSSKYVSMYDVYIYSSRTKVKGKWKTMYHKRLKQNKDCIESKGEGKYFYKYRIEDKWNRKSKFSGMGEIYFPISPLDDF